MIAQSQLEVKYNRSKRRYEVLNGRVHSEHRTKLDARISVIRLLNEEIYQRLAKKARFQSEAVQERLVKAAELVIGGRVNVHNESQYGGRVILAATVDSDGDGETIRHIRFVCNEDRFDCDCEDFVMGHAPDDRCKHILAYELINDVEYEAPQDYELDLF